MEKQLHPCLEETADFVCMLLQVGTQLMLCFLSQLTQQDISGANNVIPTERKANCGEPTP